MNTSRDDRIGWSPADKAYYAFGYQYIVPLVGRYVQVGYAAGYRLRWSFIGLDRTAANRSIVMGEYKTSDQEAGRLTWWNLDEATGRLAIDSPEPTQDASLARQCSSERYLQGCHSHDALDGGNVWLSRTASRDALFERPLNGGDGSTFDPWAQQPEGLTYSPHSDNLWCITESHGARAVFAVKRAGVQG